MITRESSRNLAFALDTSMCAAARPPSTRPSIRCGVAFPMCSISTPTAKAQKLKVSLADCGFHAHEHGCQMAIARFLESYVFGPLASELWLRYATLQNVIPSFPWLAPGWREGIKFCHLATMLARVIFSVCHPVRCSYSPLLPPHSHSFYISSFWPPSFLPPSQCLSV